MMRQLKNRCGITVFVLCSYLLVVPAAPSYSLSLLDPEKMGNQREYFSANKENRLLVKVHVLGDVPLAGIHHVPDNVTLLDLIGYAGGPAGNFSDARITVSRLSTDKKQVKAIEMDGESLVQKPELRNLSLHSGDVVYLEAPNRDAFLKTLTIVSSVLGIVLTSTTLYLLTR